jgi:3-oxoacyl-[acyl-carrier protein] reductase
MFDLSGKTALVTGRQVASVARSRARCMRKAPRSRSRARAARCWMRWRPRLGSTAVLPCDLADKDAVEALVPDAEKALGQVDILVANAGITKDNLFVALKDEDGTRSSAST